MPCPRDLPPFGYGIQHSNAPAHPCWLVMRWGEILQLCPTLEAAYLWLVAKLEA